MMSRIAFLLQTSLLSAGAVISPISSWTQITPEINKSVAIIGCGCLSGVYPPSLKTLPPIDVATICDIKPELSGKRAAEFKLTYQYPFIDKSQAGAPVCLLEKLTDMQEHGRHKKLTLGGGKTC
jgi:hypothetical protein